MASFGARPCTSNAHTHKHTHTHTRVKLHPITPRRPRSRMVDWGDVNRYNFTAEVTSQELVESYLPAFESCVRDARGASIMCSYNAVEVVSDVDPLPSTPSVSRRLLCAERGGGRD